jgi:hypothetical protein
MKKVKNLFGTLNFGVVREDDVWHAMQAYEVFKSAWHVGFEQHGIYLSSRAVQLGHRDTSIMIKDSIVMRWSITEECVIDNLFDPMIDIASGKA